jgi:CheY-like chemotaxis protein
MDFSDCTIMICDDEVAYRKFLKTILEKSLKADVIEAKNPKEVFDYLNQNPVPSLIFMDMQMPVMDGYTAIKILRRNAKTANVPIIACTALGSKEIVVSLAKLKVNDFIVKPLSDEIIIEKVKKILTDNCKQKSEENTLESEDMSNDA